MSGHHRSLPHRDWTIRGSPIHSTSTATRVSDGWEYMTPFSSTAVEILASDQTPHAEDGESGPRVCPNDQIIERNAHLRMEYAGEEIDLDFRGPFQFMRHVS